MNIELQQFLFTLGGIVLGWYSTSVFLKYKALKQELGDAKQEIQRLQNKISDMQRK